VLEHMIVFGSGGRFRLGFLDYLVRRVDCRHIGRRKRLLLHGFKRFRDRPLGSTPAGLARSALGARYGPNSRLYLWCVVFPTSWTHDWLSRQVVEPHSARVANAFGPAQRLLGLIGCGHWLNSQNVDRSAPNTFGMPRWSALASL
jgi:hypothetical protein